MKKALIAASFFLAASSCIAAQESGNAVFVQAPAGPGPGALATFQMKSPAPVTGAPYSATTTTQSTQTLSDGNRIVQSFTGNTARDSQGRTRQDAPLPNIGNLSAANAPHIAFIQDPVGQVVYTLNLTDKTAQKMPMPPAGARGADADVGPEISSSAVPGPAGGKFMIQMQSEGPAPGAFPPPVAIAGMIAGDEAARAKTEDLGSQTMEGVAVNGTRITHTIPAGQIGNEQPISIVTEIWTSPDLKTVVYSKRTDPRTGEQTFQLTNIVRAEPDASLFTVPADFTVVDGPKPIIYRANQ